MRKFAYVFCLILVFTFVFSLVVSAMDISAKGAVLIEAQSGEVVLGKNENTQLPMASTTKIMTALVVLDTIDTATLVKIEPYMTNIEGSSIYLQEGEELTVLELLYALMLESANDAAVALAYTVGGSIEAFAEMMNEKALSLGLTSTHFTNPHGLDDNKHYTTPYELGVIAVNAMKNPVFKEIVSTYKKTIPLNGGEGTRVLINHNRLLRSYDGAIGIKTGFTKKCGRCLVSCAERDGVMLVCVTLNAPSDWQDHTKMLDYGFSQYVNIELASPQDYTIKMNAINGDKSSFLATNLDGLNVTLKKNNVNISAVFEANRLICAPINKGDTVGRIVFYNNGDEIGSLAIVSKEQINDIKYKKSIFERLFG